MRKIEKSNLELTNKIREILPEIDKHLNSIDKKLSSRPMAATMTLLDAGFITVNVESTEKPYLQVWFAVLFAIVMGWYEKKYGAALNAETGILKGLVEIHGLPFILNVPQHYGIKDAETGNLQVCFDPALGESETPREWIIHPPALENLTQRQSERLDRDFKLITKTLRTINLKLMIGSPAPEQYMRYRAIALISINKAAEKISPQDQAQCSSAVWDIYFAVENMLKALIAQRGQQPDSEHSLSHLVKQAQTVGVEIEEPLNLGFLPGPSLAIDCRYGKQFPGGYRKVLVMYQKTLPLLLYLSSKVQQTLTLGDGAGITLQRPPWFKFLYD
jgi:hypothetical protein